MYATYFQFVCKFWVMIALHCCIFEDMNIVNSKNFEHIFLFYLLFDTSHKIESKAVGHTEVELVFHIHFRHGAKRKERR